MGSRRDEVRLSARQNARLRERLDAFSRREGLTLTALAKQAGVSIGAVRNIGKTKAGPTLGTLIALARVLRLRSIDQLLGPSGSALFSQHDSLDGEAGEDGMDRVMTADLPAGNDMV